MSTYHVTYTTPGGTYGSLDLTVADGFDVRRAFRMEMASRGFSRQSYTWHAHYTRLR